MADPESENEEYSSSPECLSSENMFFPDQKNKIEQLSRRNSIISPFVTYNASPEETQKFYNTQFQELSKISLELLSRSASEFESKSFERELRDLELAYKTVTAKFVYKIDKFLASVKELGADLGKTLKEFRLISCFTARVTVFSSVTNVFLMIGRPVFNMFQFTWRPNFSLISTVVGSMSITTSLLALSYMRRVTSELAKTIRKDNRILLDMVTAHRKGNWIDDEVFGLFPFGFNLSFVNKRNLEDPKPIEDKFEWRKNVCSVIILTNTQKDARLLNDDVFLTRVKLFVESPVAEIWWSRIQIKILLEKLRKKADKFPAQEFIAGHENHIYRIALYLYPVIIPWLISSLNTERIRLLCTTIAGIRALFDLLNDESEELEDLKRISDIFASDFKEIPVIHKILGNEYD